MDKAVRNRVAQYFRDAMPKTTRMSPAVEKLKELIIRSGHNPTSFALAAGIDKSTVSTNWLEKGKIPSAPNKAWKLACAKLGVLPGPLLQGEVEWVAGEPPAAMTFDDKVKILRSSDNGDTLERLIDQLFLAHQLSQNR